MNGAETSRGRLRAAMTERIELMPSGCDVRRRRGQFEADEWFMVDGVFNGSREAESRECRVMRDARVRTSAKKPSGSLEQHQSETPGKMWTMGYSQGNYPPRSVRSSLWASAVAARLHAPVAPLRNLDERKNSP